MNGVLSAHENKVNRTLTLVMGGAFLAFFLILMFVSRVEFARSSVLLVGFVLAVIIGLASRKKYLPLYKYLNTGLLGLILTLLMNLLGEKNTGVPTAMVMSLIVVAMYYQERLVAVYTLLLVLLNGINAYVSPEMYLTTYTATNWISIIVIFLLGAILAWFLARMAAQLIGFAEQKERDARQMAEEIRSIQGKARSLVERTSQIGEELSRSTTQTAGAVEAVASSVEELSAITENLNITSQQIATSAQGVNGLAGQGLEQMQGTLRTMEDVLRFSRDSQGVVEKLETASNQINTIVDLIADVAEQTNLLALNAAIEAARAGDHGRGFAVVAEEIRHLAEDTRTSTGEIRSLIRELLGQTTTVRDVFVQSNQKIESGFAVMTDTATTLDTIVEQIEEVAREVQEIARATQELSTGSEEIAGSSQEQASSARTISDAADSLAELTRELRGFIQS